MHVALTSLTTKRIASDSHSAAEMCVHLLPSSSFDNFFPRVWV